MDCKDIIKKEGCKVAQEGPEEEAYTQQWTSQAASDDDLT